MKKDSGAIIGGLLVLGAIMLRKTSSGIAWGEGWHWPVPDWLHGGVTYPAVVSQEFRRPTHYGTDIMYKRRSVSDLVSEFPPGAVGHATTMFFAPPGAPILAARDARVWSVDKAATGWQVVLDHGKPWATYYGHLDTVALAGHAKGFVTGTQNVTNVKAGDQIGTMGFNPNTDPAKGAADGGQIRHLHFECWYKGAGNDAAVDPVPVMAQWGRSQWA